jgi:lipoprotein NlpI
MSKEIAPTRRWRFPILLVVVLSCTACDDGETATQKGVDRQACLGSELRPVDALTACSRFISTTNENAMPLSSAYYNRGVAFSELQEFQHARLDLEKSLDLEPKNHWARQRLQDIEQKLSKSEN